MYELVLLQQKTNYRNIIFQFCYYIFRLFTTSSYTFSCVVIYLKMRKYLTLATKQIILDEAYCRQGNIKATARKYDVQPQQIRRWKKTFRNAEELSGHKLSSYTFHKGPEPSPEGWAQLKDFYLRLREDGRLCTIKYLAFEYARITNSTEPIKSIMWKVHRWKKRENLVYRRVTHVAQNTRHNEQIINDFVLYTNEQITSGQYSACDIVNMDETNVYFDLPSGITLESRGSRSVAMRSSGSNNRCTVLLAVSMSGEKLPPFIVFKGVPNGRISREFGNGNYPTDCIYDVQEKAWVDQRIFLIWVEKVWKPFTQRKKTSYFLMDEFSVHMQSECIEAMQRCGTEVDTIVAGYTSRLQVLDVGINKPFKGYVIEEYEKFMRENPHGTKPKRKHVANWVSTAWQQIRHDTICNTWRSIGFKTDENDI